MLVVAVQCYIHLLHTGKLVLGRLNLETFPGAGSGADKTVGDGICAGDGTGGEAGCYRRLLGTSQDQIVILPFGSLLRLPSPVRRFPCGLNGPW